MKAIILLSGGLDSAVILALALEQKRECLALSFDYHQRHAIELDYARKLTAYYQVPHQIIQIDPSFFKNTSLVDLPNVPKHRSLETIHTSFPSTYVPARNTLFLSYAIGMAEIWNANEIHFGPNAMDTGPYVDCRPEYVQAMQQVARLGTRQGVNGNGAEIMTPLIHLNKEQIGEKAKDLKVPIDLTWSCYDPQGKDPCRCCDACTLRESALFRPIQA